MIPTRRSSPTERGSSSRYLDYFLYIMIIIITISLYFLLSWLRPSKKKINLFAVFLCSLISPGILFLILNHGDSTSVGKIFAVAASVLWFVISFFVSLILSFLLQLHLLRELNCDTDEMNRQLWLCDKLLIRSQAEGKDQKSQLKDCVKNMNIFLTLRQKHFGIESVAEQHILVSYLDQNDITNIQMKLNEYKTWVARELYE